MLSVNNVLALLSSESWHSVIKSKVQHISMFKLSNERGTLTMMRSRQEDQIPKEQKRPKRAYPKKLVKCIYSIVADIQQRTGIYCRSYFPRVFMLYFLICITTVPDYPTISSYNSRNYILQASQYVFPNTMQYNFR